MLCYKNVAKNEIAQFCWGFGTVRLLFKWSWNPSAVFLLHSMRLSHHQWAKKKRHWTCDACVYISFKFPSVLQRKTIYWVATSHLPLYACTDFLSLLFVPVLNANKNNDTTARSAPTKTERRSLGSQREKCRIFLHCKRQTDRRVCI